MGDAGANSICRLRRIDQVVACFDPLIPHPVGKTTARAGSGGKRNQGRDHPAVPGRLLISGSGAEVFQNGLGLRFCSGRPPAHKNDPLQIPAQRQAHLLETGPVRAEIRLKGDLRMIPADQPLEQTGSRWLEVEIFRGVQVFPDARPETGALGHRRQPPPPSAQVQGIVVRGGISRSQAVTRKVSCGQIRGGGGPLVRPRRSLQLANRQHQGHPGIGPGLLQVQLTGRAAQLHPDPHRQGKHHHHQQGHHQQGDQQNRPRASAPNAHVLSGFARCPVHPPHSILRLNRSVRSTET